MPKDCITYEESGYYSQIIIDYLNQDAAIAPFSNRFPTVENFKHQTTEKGINYTIQNRKVLVKALTNQYQNFKTSELVTKNIAQLEKETTFTITTGHQLNLFTGPLYFLYKIISTINLCKQLNSCYLHQKFVPVYWMATEDHDFEEINYFNFKDKKIKWSKNTAGPVGRLSTEGLDAVFNVFETTLGSSTNATYLKNVFKKAYLENETLADATRFLANELFKNDGLVIIDADSSDLKQLMIPYFKEELLHQKSFKAVSETNAKLTKYKIQVNPREINLFYIEDNLRERIIFENGKYKVNNTKIEFSQSEIVTELNNYPEKFSPNVLLRPLYEEVILPNLAYIGGGGEIAYWLQLKSTFKMHNITFPILILRNSVLLISDKQLKKMDHLQLSIADLFLTKTALSAKKTSDFTKLPVDFTTQKTALKTQFEQLYTLALQTDASFTGAVKAQEIKQLKGLQNLEQRLLKAEKRIYKDKLDRIAVLHEALFPGESLQERKQNFSEFYVEVGPDLLSKISADLNPLAPYFNVITLREQID